MKPAENYILNQQEPFRSILLHLQSVIETTLPEANLKFKYKIPFYYIDTRPFCYLNQAKDYIDVGFWNSTHLRVHLEKLCSDGRKKIKSLRYRSLEEIDHEILTAILKDAYDVRHKKFYSE